jgi:hypothetical protein
MITFGKYQEEPPFFSGGLMRSTSITVYFAILSQYEAFFTPVDSAEGRIYDLMQLLQTKFRHDPACIRIAGQPIGLSDNLFNESPACVRRCLFFRICEDAFKV